MSELAWETLDLEAVYPETVHSATGTACEYRIAHYRPDRDGKAYDRGPNDNWSLTTHRISAFVLDPFSEGSYHSSLESANARASEMEARITA